MPEEAREEAEALLPPHHGIDVGQDRAIAFAQPCPFGAFATEQCDLLRVFADTRHSEAKVRLKALLVEIQRDQRPTDEMGEHRPDRGIDDGDPDQIAGNVERKAEARHRERDRQLPQDQQEDTEPNGVAEESDP